MDTHKNNWKYCILIQDSDLPKDVNVADIINKFDRYTDEPIIGLELYGKCIYAPLLEMCFTISEVPREFEKELESAGFRLKRFSNKTSAQQFFNPLPGYG